MSDAVPRGLVAALGSITGLMMFLAAVAAQNDQQTADAQIAFQNNCQSCHSIKKGENLLGPDLHQVLGRKAGTASNYQYSKAMVDANVVWDEAALDSYIQSPHLFLPDGSKQLLGVDSAEERRKIILFLRDQADS